MTTSSSARPCSDAGGNARGTVHLLFGKAAGFATVDLGALAPADGFAITGAADVDSIGESLASAGDLNGDGYDDFLIGVRNNDDGGTGAGKTWVIFGKASGFTDIDLDAVVPADGFAIQGAAAADDLGRSVDSAGDFNGDGHADLIVGMSGSDIGGGSSGAAFILFGKAGGFADIDLANVSATDGVFIIGESASDSSGRSVSSAGDVNGDGFDDVIVGATSSDAGGTASGSAYIVFGRAGPLATSSWPASATTRASSSSAMPPTTRPVSASPRPATSTATAMTTSSSARPMATMAASMRARPMSSSAAPAARRPTSR